VENDRNTQFMATTFANTNIFLRFAVEISKIVLYILFTKQKCTLPTVCTETAEFFGM